MRKLIPFILVCILVITSCSSTSWIGNPYASYSREIYVAAVGYGDSADTADSNAKAELASLFGLRVTSVTARTVTESLTSYDENFMRANVSYADVDNLYGVEIAKRAVDKDGRHVSLAVMEKKPTLEYLEGNIVNERNAVERLYALVAETTGTLTGLENARSLVTSVSDYNTHIAMINYLSGKNEEYLDEKSASDKWQEARDSVSIAVSVSGDDSGAVKGKLLSLMTACGLRVADNPEDAASSVECSIDMREIQGSGVASSFVFAEYDAVITMADSASGKTILSYSYNGKEGHSNYTSAVTRALKDLCGKISSSLGEEMKEKFGNL